jgi:hypothetical protein
VAEIHRTTLVPSKLELLSVWLPEQAWCRADARPPQLVKAGGFRLDDPSGEVGIEFMFVTDGSGSDATTYHVPLSYRGAPVARAESALIGTSEHGVLGRRWIYDGTHDPVVVAQLLSLVQGGTEPQHQSRSATVDHSITRHSHREDRLVAVNGTVSGAVGGRTTIAVTTVNHAGAPDQDVIIEVVRVLGSNAGESLESETAAGFGYVSAPWLRPDGTTARGRVVLAR